VADDDLDLESPDEALMARAFAFGFEASVYRPTQVEKTDGTGDLLVTIALRVNGSNAGVEQLLAARAGSVFMLGGVQLDGVGGPKAPEEDWGRRAFGLAHTFVNKNLDFVVWMVERAGEQPAMLDLDQMKQIARKGIHAHCEIASRTELLRSFEARIKLYDLINLFHQSRSKTGWLGPERERTR